MPTTNIKQPEDEYKRNPTQPNPSVGCSMCYRVDVPLKWIQSKRSYFCINTNDCINYMAKEGMF